jgi:hypothetical protein
MSFIDTQNGWLASAHQMGVGADRAASWRIMEELKGTHALHIVGISLYANQGYMMNSSGALGAQTTVLVAANQPQASGLGVPLSAAQWSRCASQMRSLAWL